MGCGKSKGVVVEKVQEEAVEQKKKARLSQTWSILEKSLDQAATKWLRRLIQQAPQTLDHFPFNGTEDSQNSKWLLIHARSSWRVIGRLVNSPEDQQLVMAEVRTVARSHRAFKLSREVLDIATTIFLQVLEEEVGPSAWDEELKAGFKEVFDIVANEMVQDSPSAATPAEEEIEAARSHRILEEDWNVIKQDLDGNGATLIQRVIESGPDALLYFPFQQDNPFADVSNQEDLEAKVQSLCSEDENLRGHGRLMLRTFGRAVQNCRNLAAIEEELSTIGKSHVVLKMRPLLFAKVGKALLWLLETRVGKDKWDQDRQEAWEALIDFVVTTISKPSATE